MGIQFLFNLNKNGIEIHHYYSGKSKRYNYVLSKRDDKIYRFKVELKDYQITLFQIEYKYSNILFSSLLWINDYKNINIKFIGYDDDVKINIDGDDQPLLCGGYIIDDTPILYIHYEIIYNGAIENVDIYNQEDSVPSNSLKYAILEFSSTYLCQKFTIHQITIDEKVITNSASRNNFIIKIPLDVYDEGKHSLFINHSKGVMKFNFNIVPSELETLKFYGHDGIKYENLKSNTFNWGNVEGNFKLSDFNDGYLKVDFSAYDNRNNKINNLDVNEIKKNIILNTADEDLDFEFVHIKNEIYEIKVQINKPGKYTLESIYFSEIYKYYEFFYKYYEFIVYENKPSSTSCELKSLKTYKANEEVIFECEIIFNDQKKALNFGLIILI